MIEIPSEPCTGRTKRWLAKRFSVNTFLPIEYGICWFGRSIVCTGSQNDVGSHSQKESQQKVTAERRTGFDEFDGERQRADGWNCLLI